jgi:para-aminobenzoate synthetase component 1
MQRAGFEDWQRWWAEGCRLLPVFAVHRDTELPADWGRLAARPVVVLLESARRGRYTLRCDRPRRVIVGSADAAEVWNGTMTERWETRRGDPLAVLQQCLGEVRAPRLANGPAMTGGLLGVFGYDLVHTWEKLPRRASRDVEVPLYAFVEAAELLIYDHLERTLTAVVWTKVDDKEPQRDTLAGATRAAEAALERWGGRDSGGSAALVIGSSDGVPGPSFSDAGFEEAVRRVQEYIAAGHSYQVNLSLRESRPTPHGAWEIYEALRRVNPSPYMGLMQFPEWALVCGSPELLVRLVDGTLRSRPIAGTRPRGQGHSADGAFFAELQASPKERAEHLMLVDLIRNDIGRVAEFGSVRVTEFMAVERYSHVMHLVSEVEGRLAAGRGWPEVLRAMFPGGTITGCPKVRTMELIEELEPVGRGFYTGGLGWISYGGDMEVNIAIRSMLVKGGVAHVQTGAGIVADSEPHRELDEVRRKAQALWIALENPALTND